MSTWRFVERTNADSRYQKGKYVETLHIAANDCPLIHLCMQQTGHLTQSLSLFQLSSKWGSITWSWSLHRWRMEKVCRRECCQSFQWQSKEMFNTHQSILCWMWRCSAVFTAQPSMWLLLEGVVVWWKWNNNLVIWIEDLRGARWQTSAKHNLMNQRMIMPHK